MRRWGAFLAVAALGVVAPAPEASANPGCARHYAGQQTTVSSSTNSNGCATLTSFYFGWAGVNGRMEAPVALVPLANTNTDHVNGSIGMTFSGAPDVQVGWFRGTIFNTPTPPSSCAQPACVSSTSQYGMYVEWRTSSTYNIKNFGGVAAGLGLVYRVQKDASGNWRVYDYYNNLLQTISGLPSTGAASAFIEHFRYSAASPVPGSPEVDFGASSPNTNNAMRLLGAKGYEPWDTSLLAGGTEKFYDQGESTFVSYSPNYWFGAWFNG